MNSDRLGPSDSPDARMDSPEEPRRHRPEELVRPVRFLVEGATAHGFWTGVSRRLGFDHWQIHDFRGVDQLGAYLRVLLQAPGFDTVVRSVVVGRDAEKDAHAALQSVWEALRKCDLPCPAGPFEWAGDGPLRVCVLIWPQPVRPNVAKVWQGSGMLEDMCLATLPDSALHCADAFLECVESSGRRLKRRAKSRLQTYLAGTEHAGLRLGDATAAGAWNLESPVLSPYTALLSRASSLAGVKPPGTPD